MPEQSKLIRRLVVCTLLLVGAHVVNEMLGGPNGRVTHFLHLDSEKNLPTWFSSLLWLLCAGASCSCWKLCPAGRRGRFCWRIMTFGFLLASADEVAMIHEEILRPAVARLLPEAFLQSLNSTFAYSAWPAVVAPVLLVAGIAFLFFVKWTLSESREATIRVLTGASLLITGAVVLELTANFLQGADQKLFLDLEVVAEESLEMFGVILILSGIFAYQKNMLWRRELATQEEQGQSSGIEAPLFWPHGSTIGTSGSLSNAERKRSGSAEGASPEVSK